jgi:hypothetical protein
MTEGPYWVEEHLTRRDVTEGMHGLPLILRLSVVRASTCRAIKNADGQRRRRRGPHFWWPRR